MKTLFGLPLLVQGLIQSMALVTYILLVATFIFNLDFFINDEAENGVLGFITFLLLFIISATVSATIVLGRSGYLFWEKKYRESFTLLGWTVGWSFVFLIKIVAVASGFLPVTQVLF